MSLDSRLLRIFRNSWSWWWAECNNHGWALWLAVQNEWRALFATTPVSLRVFGFFGAFLAFFCAKNAATLPPPNIPRSEQLNPIHNQFFEQLSDKFCMHRALWGWIFFWSFICKKLHDSWIFASKLDDKVLIF